MWAWPSIRRRRRNEKQYCIPPPPPPIIHDIISWLVMWQLLFFCHSSNSVKTMLPMLQFLHHWCLPFNSDCHPQSHFCQTLHEHNSSIQVPFTLQAHYFHFILLAILALFYQLIIFTWFYQLTPVHFILLVHANSWKLSLHRNQLCQHACLLSIILLLYFNAQACQIILFHTLTNYSLY